MRIVKIRVLSARLWNFLDTAHALFLWIGRYVAFLSRYRSLYSSDASGTALRRVCLSFFLLDYNFYLLWRLGRQKGVRSGGL